MKAAEGWCQTKTTEYSNVITAIPALLELLAVKANQPISWSLPRTSSTRQPTRISASSGLRDTTTQTKTMVG